MKCPQCDSEIEASVELACGHSACELCIAAFAERGQLCPASAYCRNVPLCYAGESHEIALARKRRELVVAQARAAAADLRFAAGFGALVRDRSKCATAEKQVARLERQAACSFADGWVSPGVSWQHCRYYDVAQYFAKGVSPFEKRHFETTEARPIVKRPDRATSASKVYARPGYWAIRRMDGSFLVWEGSWSTQEASALVPLSSRYRSVDGFEFEIIDDKQARLLQRETLEFYQTAVDKERRQQQLFDKKIAAYSANHEVQTADLYKAAKYLESDVEALEMRIEFNQPLVCSLACPPPPQQPTFVAVGPWAMPEQRAQWLVKHKRGNVISLDESTAIILNSQSATSPGSVLLHTFSVVDGNIVAGDKVVRIAHSALVGGYVEDCQSATERVFWFTTEQAYWRAVSLDHARLGELVTDEQASPLGRSSTAYPGGLVTCDPRTRQLFQIEQATKPSGMPRVVAIADYY